MSAGNFTTSKYQASYGSADQVHPIRLQPETIAATGGGESNDPPVDDVNNPISAIASRGNRQLGLRPRYIRCELAGTPPTNYSENSIAKIICLTLNFYNAVAIKGTTVTYLGTTWTVVGFQPERAS